MTAWAMAGWARALTPLGWGLGLIVAMVVGLILARGIGLRWDPLDLTGRRLEAQVARNAVLQTDLAARRLEHEATVAGQARADHRQSQRTELVRATVAAETDARHADDADQPLDADRLERLRAHDRRLCQLSPGVCADPAASDRPADAG